MDTLKETLSGSGAFAVYFVVSLALVVVFVLLYSAITPYREIKLIREGNRAAALSLGGAILGFVIPMGRAVAQSASLTDMLAWAGIALVAQLLAYTAAGVCVPHLRRTIAEGRDASGILLASLSIAIGILNAACLTA